MCALLIPLVGIRLNIVQYIAVICLRSTTVVVLKIVVWQTLY